MTNIAKSVNWNIYHYFDNTICKWNYKVILNLKIITSKEQFNGILKLNSMYRFKTIC